MSDDDNLLLQPVPEDSKAYTSHEIKLLLKQMDASKLRHAALKAQGRTKEYYEAVAAECKELSEQFPSIFEPHIEDRLPGEIFYLLEHLRKIEQGKETVKDADIKIGKKMARNYVYPMLKQEEPKRAMSYAEYYNQNL